MSESSWKFLTDDTAKVSYYLTGESVLRAATIPERPGSKSPTTVRATHLNSYQWIDSDLYVRIGDPVNPLEPAGLDTVDDWRPMNAIEDLIEDEGYVCRPRRKKEIQGWWLGTFEMELHFPKGHHLIELKLISRVEHVCSIVLSNWKVYVR